MGDQENLYLRALSEHSGAGRPPQYDTNDFTLPGNRPSNKRRYCRPLRQAIKSFRMKIFWLIVMNISGKKMSANQG